jgi:hypothetical protein
MSGRFQPDNGADSAQSLADAMKCCEVNHFYLMCRGYWMGSVLVYGVTMLLHAVAR